MSLKESLAVIFLFWLQAAVFGVTVWMEGENPEVEQMNRHPQGYEQVKAGGGNRSH